MFSRGRREAKEKEIMAEKYSDQLCDTELCLSPCGLPTRRPPQADSLANFSSQIRTQHQPAAPAEKPGEQQLTIFYGGQMCVCDVTEIQAKAIICKAKHELEGVPGVQHHIVERTPAASRYMTRSFSLPTVTEAAQQQLQSGGHLSMKRSLQLFLEKRKTRAHVEEYWSSSPNCNNMPSTTTTCTQP